MDELKKLTLQQLKELPEYDSLPSSMKKSTLRVGELRKAIHNYREKKEKFTCEEQYHLSPDELMNTMRSVLAEYYKHGPRSSKKIDILHFFIHCLILQELRRIAPDLMPDIRVYSQPFEEANVSGMLYNKDVDITIRYNKDHDVGIVSVKFITSNYVQNSNNYFESLLGETINLKGVDSKPRIVWFSMFTFKNIPYYNKDNAIKNYEKFEKKHIDRYKLLWEYSSQHKILPDCVSVTVLHNKKNMKHPNKIKEDGMSDEDIELMIRRLLLGEYNEEIPIQFYPQLKIFCKKVVNLIHQKYTKKIKTS